jgi:hypothetical protein
VVGAAPTVNPPGGHHQHQHKQQPIPSHLSHSDLRTNRAAAAADCRPHSATASPVATTARPTIERAHGTRTTRELAQCLRLHQRSSPRSPMVQARPKSSHRRRPSRRGSARTAEAARAVQRATAARRRSRTGLPWKSYYTDTSMSGATQLEAA